MSKNGLRKVKGSTREPVVVPPYEPPPQAWDNGPHRIPIRAGHPDTELHFVTDDGVVVAVMRMMDMTMTVNQGGTARFEDMTKFAGPVNLNPFTGYSDHEHEIQMNGKCAVCGVLCV